MIINCLFWYIPKNIRGLASKIDELRIIVSELHSGLQLLTFSETWAHKDITDSELGIPGYQLFRRDRDNKGGDLAVSRLFLLVSLEKQAIYSSTRETKQETILRIYLNLGWPQVRNAR